MCGQKSPFVSVLTNTPKSVIILGGNCCFMQTLWSRGHTSCLRHISVVNPPILTVLQILSHSSVCEGCEVVNHGFKSTMGKLGRCSACANSATPTGETFCSLYFSCDLFHGSFPAPVLPRVKTRVRILNPQRWDCRQSNRAQIHLQECSARTCAHSGAWHLVPIFSGKRQERAEMQR